MEEQMLWISIPHKQLIGLGFFIRELCLLVQNFIFLCHSVITTFHFSSGKNQKHYINTFVKGTHFTSNIVCRHESLSHLLDLPLSLESSHLHELLRRCRSRGSGSAGLSHQPRRGWGWRLHSLRENRFVLPFDQPFFYMVLTDLFYQLWWSFVCWLSCKGADPKIYTFPITSKFRCSISYLQGLVWQCCIIDCPQDNLNATQPFFVETVPLVSINRDAAWAETGNRCLAKPYRTLPEWRATLIW